MNSCGPFLPLFSGNINPPPRFCSSPSNPIKHHFPLPFLSGKQFKTKFFSILTLSYSIPVKLNQLLDFRVIVFSLLCNFYSSYCSCEFWVPIVFRFHGKLMGHWSSMFNGLARSLSIKKVKNSGNGDMGREAAEAMAKDAKKKDLVLKCSGIVSVIGSNNFASVFTKKGQKGINQDCSIVWEEFGCQPDMIFCGIFDGHGPWGHFVAKTVRESLLPSLLCHWQEETLAQMALDSNYNQDEDKMVQWFNLWKNSYLKTCARIDQELEHHPTIDAFYSGTTALSIVKQGERMIIANVGDSRAVLATTSDNGDLVAVQLTMDFKPNLPQEAERIAGCNGRVFCLADEPGVHRVWLPDEELPGLAMSRAFGDYCIKDFGLISVPELIFRNISSKDQFIVLATDGVWDVISNQEAVEVVGLAQCRAKACKQLVDHAVRAWKKKRRGVAMDDISAICLFFHSSSLSSSTHQIEPNIVPTK